jgi:hypothetical protein
VLRVAAGVVVFAAAATGIGSLIGHLGSATSRKTSEHSAAEPAPAAGRAAGPKAPLPSGSLNAQRGSVDYNAASLPSLVHELVSRQVAAGRFEPNDVLPRPACALVNVAALKQLASASVIFDGQPATVVVLTDPAHPNTWIVRVLRAGCVPAYGVELPAS